MPRGARGRGDRVRAGGRCRRGRVPWVPRRRADLWSRAPGGDREGRAEAPAGDRDHRQLPRHLRARGPQPGRPHRHRTRGSGRRPRRRQPLDLPRAAQRRPRGPRPLGRCPGGVGRRVPRRTTRGRCHRHLREGRGVPRGARRLHQGAGLGGLERARLPRGHPAPGRVAGWVRRTPRSSRSTRWCGAAPRRTDGRRRATCRAASSGPMCPARPRPRPLRRGLRGSASGRTPR